MQGQILTAAAVLVVWSLVMLFWMAGSRLPALSKLGGLGKAKPGGRGQDLEGVIPDQINWKAHNYSHLMEQPTLFYATVVILAIMGAGAVDVALAWGYVVIRIVHSIWQATVNRLPVRFLLFALSSLCLIGLALRALGATLGHG
ncbi:MAG: hypothetical protein C0409_00595 [Novosphingobium sp.]|nr:hypothetical protein [Novosphingobium sp.]